MTVERRIQIALGLFDGIIMLIEIGYQVIGRSAILRIMRDPDQPARFADNLFIVFVVPFDKARVAQQVFRRSRLAILFVFNIGIRKLADKHQQAISQIVFHHIVNRRVRNITVRFVRIAGILFCAKQHFDRITKRFWTSIVQRIGHERSEHDCSADRQRSARPPQMQSRNMSVTNRFIADALRRNLLDRHRHFYEFFCLSHTGYILSFHSCIGKKN